MQQYDNWLHWYMYKMKAQKFGAWQSGLPDLSWHNKPKRGNNHKIYRITTKFVGIPNGRKIDQMAIKYTNIFHRKTLQNLPKFGFLVLKFTIGNPGNLLLPVTSARALELKKQEDYKLVQMLWAMKKDMAHQKFSTEWVPSCK
jgi:hypothetical protein